MCIPYGKTESDRYLIFYLCIPYGKTFSLVPTSRSSVNVKVKYQGHTFQKLKWPLWGHYCFTNAAFLSLFFKSAVAFNLGMFEVLSCGKELNI